MKWSFFRTQMGTDRAAKLAGTLKKKISEIIQTELKDPRIGFVTITDVEVSADLKYAKIYFSIFGNESQKKSTLIGLKHATGFIKHHIAKEVELKFMPDIVFKFDETHERQQRINELLERVKREDEQRAKRHNKGAKEIR